SVGAEALQLFYNRLDRRAEEMYFAHAERDRLGILGRVPLASGILSGKFKTDAQFSPNEYRGSLDREKLKHDLEEVERIRAAEVPEGVPMAQWALAWCLRNPVVTTVIPGMKSAEQARANAAAADLVDA